MLTLGKLNKDTVKYLLQPLLIFDKDSIIPAMDINFFIKI